MEFYESISEDQSIVCKCVKIDEENSDEKHIILLILAKILIEKKKE